MTLQPEIIKQVKANHKLVSEIEIILNRRNFTVMKYLRENNESLLHYGVLKAISSNLDISIENIIMN